MTVYIKYSIARIFVGFYFRYGELQNKKLKSNLGIMWDNRLFEQMRGHDMHTRASRVFICRHVDMIHANLNKNTYLGYFRFKKALCSTDTL